jgi:hypothetical protein
VWGDSWTTQVRFVDKELSAQRGRGAAHSRLAEVPDGLA